MTRALPTPDSPTDALVGVRHFLDLCDVPAADLRQIIDHAAAMKAAWRKGLPPTERPLAGRTLAMIFEKPSTRTRVSFDLAMRQLGGETIMLTGKEMQLGRGESIPDTARVLSRFVEIICIRILDHSAMQELAANSSVPIINALTKRSHPCQIMADILTYEERCGPITGRTVAWCGDGNNVLASWVHAAQRFGFKLRIATPKGLELAPVVLEWARASKADVEVGHDPHAAVAGADCVVTDCWLSMGDEEKTARYTMLKPFQVNAKLMAEAAPEAIFMHCLPAHRGEEVTDEVIDGPQSVVFDEAENRLHAQKAILAWCLGSEGLGSEP